jgi:hypothetical protein
MLFTNNSYNDRYLSNYDLITKYNLTSVYNCPKIKTVTLDFSLADFLQGYEFNKLSLNDKEVQIKAFLFFYFFNGSIPFLNTKISSLVKNSEKSPDTNMSLKIKISNLNLINQFLFSLFIENWSRFLKEDIKLFSKGIKSKNLSSTFNLNLLCPASTFFEADTVLNHTITSINSKEFFVSINFLIEKPKNLNTLSLLPIVKNLPLFWING